MKPHIHIDFRQEDFKTMHELRELVKECAAEMREDHGVDLAEIAITESQHRWLKFDRYLHGEPMDVLKKDRKLFVGGVHVLVSEFDEGCPNCGGELC